MFARYCAAFCFSSLVFAASPNAPARMERVSGRTLDGSRSEYFVDP